MKPLIVLVISFVVAALASRVLRKETDLALAGRIAMSVMLMFTAIGHFVYAEGMRLMMPGFLPFKKELVWITGIFELVLAVGLLFTQTRVSAGWLLVILFVIFLPVNISAALKHVDYQKGNFEGAGPAYLWFRVPLQLLFITWTYLSAIKW